MNNTDAIAMPRQRAYSRVTHQALEMLGNLIRIRRIERGQTAQDLAERAGISRATLSKIEMGAPNAEIGTAFELASLVNVHLFDSNERILEIHSAHLKEKLTLLPKSARRSSKILDDDF